MLLLKTGCLSCWGTGVLAGGPDPCRECEGKGEVLTEDGDTIANLIYEILDRRQERQELRASLLAKAARGGVR